MRVMQDLRVFKHVVRGVSHGKIGRYRPALEALHQALQLDPQNSLARESMARLHRSLDLDQMKQDEQTLALLDFDFCIERVKSLLFDPGPSPAKLEEAHHLLDLVVSQRPALRPTIDYWRSGAPTHARRYEEAAADLERILAAQTHAAGHPDRRGSPFYALQLAAAPHPDVQ